MKTMCRMMTACALTTLLGFLSPGRAQMQFYDGTFWIGQTGAMQNIIGQDALRQQIEGGALSGPSTSGARPARTSPGMVTTFRPNADVRRRNLAQFVAKTRAADPQGAAQLEQLFASSDLIGEIGKALAPYGLKTNDVADAVAVYLVTAWYAVRGRDDDPSRAQLVAVRTQMANVLGNTPPFASATDAQKQELAEAMLIQAALIGSSVTAAKGRSALLDQVKGAVAQGVSATFGLDLRTLQLTDQGLRRT